MNFLLRAFAPSRLRVRIWMFSIALVAGLAASSNCPSATTQPATLSTMQNVMVRGFDFSGNARFSNAELQNVIQQWVGRSATPEDLEQARLDLTKFYVNQGYINSGAELPEQQVDTNPAGAVIHFNIVEGRLSDVKVTFHNDNGPTDKHLLRNSYLTDRIYDAGRPPLNLLQLKDELELLRLDPNIASINAELHPGTTPGSSELDLAVRETNPFQIGLEFSNSRPPRVGSTAMDVVLTDKDLTGHGDLFSFRYEVTNGPLDNQNWDQGRDFSIDYALPLNPSDTTILFDASRSGALVVQEPFTDLDVASDVESYAVTLRQPLYRRPTVGAPSAPGGWVTPAMEFAVFGTGTIRNDNTTLLGQSFDFVPGNLPGHSRVVALRFGQEFNARTEDDTLAMRSTFSFGLPILGATGSVQRYYPGSQFISWLGQARYTRKIGEMPGFFGRSPGNAQLVLRVAGQLTDRPLLDVEQFVVGGFDTVRGYPENMLVKDDGVAASAELQLPIIPGRGEEPAMLSLVPFFDTGYARNLQHIPGGTNYGQDLNSVGIGLVCNPNHHVNIQVYYGYALTNRSTSPEDIEDAGVHFSVNLLAF